MAMYYYARKLQKSARKAKALPQSPITANGSIPGTGGPSTSTGNISSAQCTQGASSSQQPNIPCSSTDGQNATAGNSQQQQQPGSCSIASGGSSTLKISANDWDNALVYQDTKLMSGTLDALIQHLIPTPVYYPDRAYIFAFLLSSRLYIRPHELLGCVFRMTFTSPSSSPSQEDTLQIQIVSHMVHLLGEWAELFPYDFRDEKMMAHVRSITQKCVTIDPPVRKEVSLLLTSLLARLTALERYESFLRRINTESAAVAEKVSSPSTSTCSGAGTSTSPSIEIATTSSGVPPTPGSVTSVQTMCPSPLMLAEQLTHIELERLSHIGPEEFVQAFVKETVQGEARPRDPKRTRNLESYVQWFNRLSLIVATDICKTSKKKLRVRVIEYWIEAAQECFNMGNFNSLMAIITALNMSPVARLKKTWGKVCCAQLSTLEQHMDPSSNFASYRALLKTTSWRSSAVTDDRQKIVIPFFSLLIKDLYFLNEGCASKLSNGHIIFEKFWQLAKQVTEVITWQQVTCPFPKIQAIMISIQTTSILNENALYLASYEFEGPEGSQEKEHSKSLRKEDATLTSASTVAVPVPTTSASSPQSVPSPKSKLKIANTEVSSSSVSQQSQSHSSSQPPQPPPRRPDTAIQTQDKIPKSPESPCAPNS